MNSFSVWHWLIILILLAVYVLPVWRIVSNWLPGSNRAPRPHPAGEHRHALGVCLRQMVARTSRVVAEAGGGASRTRTQRIPRIFCWNCCPITRSCSNSSATTPTPSAGSRIWCSRSRITPGSTHRGHPGSLRAGRQPREFSRKAVSKPVKPVKAVLGIRNDKALRSPQRLDLLGSPTWAQTKDLRSQTAVNRRSSILRVLCVWRRPCSQLPSIAQD